MNRTQRDIKWLADGIVSGAIRRGIPERLECLAAWHRTVAEAEKAGRGETHDYATASEAYSEAIDRLHKAGVGIPEGEFTFSPCCGPDLPEVLQ